MVAAKDTKNAVNELEEFFRMREMATAPAWRPEPDTTIAAEVVGLRMGESGYGPYPIVIYRLDSGEIVSVHAFHTLLRERLRELGTTIGKRQFISYMGKREKSNATPEEKEKGLDQYHMYFVQNADDIKNGVTGVADDFTF